MINDNLFIYNNLPNPLSNEELVSLFKEQTKEAQEKIALHNMRLVISIATYYSTKTSIDKKELVSIGSLGLTKAIQNFDLSRNNAFSTYAVRIIDNEILSFLNKNKKNSYIESLDATKYQDKDGSELRLGDIISDNSDLVDDYIDSELKKYIRKIVDNLPQRDKVITKLYFGFDNDNNYTQKEISNMLNISRSLVATIINRVIKSIGTKLEKEGFIELHYKIRKIKNNMGLQKFYEYFKEYEKEKVNELVEKLPMRNREIIKLYFGFYNNEIHSKSELAIQFYVSTPVLSQIIDDTIKELKIQLEEVDKSENPPKQKKYV